MYHPGHKQISGCCDCPGGVMITTHKSIIIRDVERMSSADIRALIDENARLRSRVIQLECIIKERDKIIMGGMEL